MKMKIPYLVRRGKTYFHRQRVPAERDEHEAAIASRAMFERYEALWARLRDPAKVAEMEAEGILQKLDGQQGDFAPDASHARRSVTMPKWVDHMIKTYGKIPSVSQITAADEIVRQKLFFSAASRGEHTLSQAMEMYLRLHANGAQDKFIGDTTRPVNRVLSLIGDKPLPDYTRADARAVLQSFISEVKTASARAYLTRIVAVVNRAIKEWELPCNNAFGGLDIKNENRDSKEVEAFTLDELTLISAACLARDDSIGWIAGMQLMSGARISEISCLRVNDLRLDDPIPHVKIREHYDLGRTLKNTESERDVPLVGIALWAAKRALASSGDHGGWLFHFDRRSKANFNWKVNLMLKKLTGTGKCSHSLRHSLICRMTVAEVPQDMIDGLVGHAAVTKSKVAAAYFHGYPLAKLRDALALVAIAGPETAS
jgi:integrase